MKLFYNFTANDKKSRIFVKTGMEEEQIIKLIEEAGGWIKSADLRAWGVNYYAVDVLLEKGLLERVQRGIYRLTSHPYDEKTEVARRIPAGVFCMFTACAYYELSTFTSAELHVAVPRKARIFLPEYPPVKLYYWSRIPLETGVIEIDSAGSKVKMYDLEKTVSDIIRLRNKIGSDLAREVMRNYVRRKDRDLVKLMHYARKLRIEKPVRNYLEILL